MNLNEVTPSHMADSSAVHVGSVEEEEVARLVAEPHAVLREAGLDVAPDTPVRIQVSREETDYLNRVGGTVIIIIIIVVRRPNPTAQ